MLSIDSMLKRIESLTDSDDLTPWENDFVSSVWEQSKQGMDTTRLSEKQIDVIERIFNKHFSG